MVNVLEGEKKKGEGGGGLNSAQCCRTEMLECNWPLFMSTLINTDEVKYTIIKANQEHHDACQ